MIQTIFLAPHDPVPEGPVKHVVVLRRFDEDSPARAAVQIILTGPRPEITHPRHPGGALMNLDDAIAAARRVAKEEGLPAIHVLDRLQGSRESDILRHDGDHSVHMARLADSQEGEEGSDMRDLIHPAHKG